jgi:hypothetical protein
MNFESMTLKELIDYQNENFDCVNCLSSCTFRQKVFCVNEYNLINDLIRVFNEIKEEVQIKED